jgi:hypothetical protein
VALSTLFTDADNSRWDAAAGFEVAHLVRLVEAEKIASDSSIANDRLAFVRKYDQAIASQHHERLHYPPNLLAHSLVLSLRGVSSIEAAGGMRRIMAECAESMAGLEKSFEGNSEGNVARNHFEVPKSLESRRLAQFSILNSRFRNR